MGTSALVHLRKELTEYDADRRVARVPESEYNH